MEKQVIDEVKRSFGRALSNKSLIQEFYDKLLQKNPEIKKKFAGIDLKKQQEVLKQSLSMAILFPQDNIIAKHAMDRVRNTHSRNNLDIKPEYYNMWMDALMEVLAKSDPEFTYHLEQQWRSVLSHVIGYIKSGY